MPSYHSRSICGPWPRPNDRSPDMLPDYLARAIASKNTFWQLAPIQILEETLNAHRQTIDSNHLQANVRKLINIRFKTWNRSTSRPNMCLGTLVCFMMSFRNHYVSQAVRTLRACIKISMQWFTCIMLPRLQASLRIKTPATYSVASAFGP